jgi:hypothetical protein
MKPIDNNDPSIFLENVTKTAKYLGLGQHNGT